MTIEKDYRAKLRGATMTTDIQNGIVLGRENSVVRSGYRSAQDQISELMKAGKSLMQSREEQYFKPTGIGGRIYGEIDRTVAEEKVEGIKAQITNRLEERKAQQEVVKTKEDEAVTTAETGGTPGGVT